jgi:hypothetical protein
LTIIVDVANVMGARADGWWQDRAGAALRLCREVGALAGRGLAPSEMPDSTLPSPTLPSSTLPSPTLPSPTLPGLTVPDVGELPGAGVPEPSGSDSGSEVSPDSGPMGARCYPAWVLVLEGRARGAADSLTLVAAGQDASSAYRQILEGSDGLVQVVLAPGSGDDVIAREAAELGGWRLVATADRELRRRCEQAGAAVAGPRWLLRLL